MIASVVLGDEFELLLEDVKPMNKFLYAIIFLIEIADEIQKLGFSSVKARSKGN
jgi:hypothetical protein